MLAISPAENYSSSRAGASSSPYHFFRGDESHVGATGDEDASPCGQCRSGDSLWTGELSTGYPHRLDKSLVPYHVSDLPTLSTGATMMICIYIFKKRKSCRPKILPGWLSGLFPLEKETKKEKKREKEKKKQLFHIRCAVVVKPERSEWSLGLTTTAHLIQ